MPYGAIVYAHSSDRDQSFQAMVILPVSIGIVIKLSIGIWRAEHRRGGEYDLTRLYSFLEIVSWSRSAGEACGLVVAIAE